MPHLEVVDISHNGPLDGLHKLLGSSNKVRRFALVSTDESDVNVAAALRGATCTKTLRVLRLDFCTQIGDATAAAIGERFEELLEVSLHGSNITSIGLYYLARACGRLIELDLSECPNIDNVSLAMIGEQFLQLEVLCLGGCTISSSGVEYLGRGCLKLSNLALQHCPDVDDATLEVIGELLPQMQFLTLSGTLVTSVGLEALAKGCKDLIHLWLDGCDGIDDETAMATCTRYWELEVLELPSQI